MSYHLFRHQLLQLPMTVPILEPLQRPLPILHPFHHNRPTLLVRHEHPVDLSHSHQFRTTLPNARLQSSHKSNSNRRSVRIHCPFHRQTSDIRNCLADKIILRHSTIHSNKGHPEIRLLRSAAQQLNHSKGYTLQDRSDNVRGLCARSNAEYSRRCLMVIHGRLSIDKK